MQKNLLKFKSEFKTISKILSEEKAEFHIPVYQRPYVWGDLEIKKFLDDLYGGFTDGYREYFIGNVYVSEKTAGVFDIIDGQQRFTTIWLLAFALKQMLDTNGGLAAFTGTPDYLRLKFSIRKEVETYFTSLLNNEFIHEEIASAVYVKGINHALKTIESVLKEKEKMSCDLKEFSLYIAEKVNFSFNIAPQNTDLNQLFVALGNSGIQLEQSDILKSKLLHHVDDKVKMAKIWEACENLNNYFENNIRFGFPKKSEQTPETSFERYETFFQSDSVTEEVKTEPAEQNTKDFLISEIINEKKGNQKGDEAGKKSTDNKCRSIIDFNLLLIHTLRLHLKKKERGDLKGAFDKKNLLKIFEQLPADETREFLLLLWEVRFLFDQYVVKWRFDTDDDHEYWDEDEKLRLTSIYDKSRKNKPHSELSMLQSILYYTGGYNHQYWLTPFLHYLLNKKETEEQIVKTLEKIDNHMLPGEKKDISWMLTNEEKLSEKRAFSLDELDEFAGTGFSHYWFYKLEYLLWKNWDRSDDQFNKFKRYRITSKNSIEHIYSQKHEHDEKLSDENWLHAFGNLALLSVGQNSSYNNQSVTKKKEDFDKKSTYDSLKLAKVYSSAEIKMWGVPQIQKHQEEMLSLLKKSYGVEM